MQINKVYRLLISKDVAVSTSGVTIANATDGAIVPFTDQNVELTTSDTIATAPSIYLAQKVTNSSNAKIGSIISLPISGTGVSNFKGESFRPAQEQITYIGLTPSATTIAAGSGDVTFTSGEAYSIAILNKEEKEITMKPERYYYTALSTDSKLKLLQEFARQINANADSVTVARVIGNGSGTDGLTSATAYGLQLKAKEAKFYFEVGISDSFAADVTTDTLNYPGVGTVTQVEALQEIAQGFLGYLNRIYLTKTITNYVASQPNSQLVSNSASGTLEFTQNSKVVTTTTGDLVAGSLAVGDEISVAGVIYGIAAVTLGGSSVITSFTLTEPFRASTVTYTASSTLFSTSDVAKLEGYDLIVIDHANSIDSIVNQNQNPKFTQTIIAVPSKLANATAKSTFLGALNAWMATLPQAFPNVTV
jgi:hypothetical protein